MNKTQNADTLVKDRKPANDSAKWQQRFHIARDKQEPIFNQAAKNFDILYAVFNDDNMAPWKSRIYLPVLSSKAWDLIARLSTIVPLFNVDPTGDYEESDDDMMVFSQEALERAMRVQGYLQKCYNHIKGMPMKLRVQHVLMDAVAAGTGYSKNPWITEKVVSKKRPVDSDGINVDLAKEEVTTTTKGYNDFQPVNFFNVFVAPGAVSFFDSPWVIVREFKPMAELKKSGLYENLSAVSTGRIDADFDKYNKSRNRVLDDNNQYDGTTSYATIFECMDKFTGEIITFAPGKGKDKAWVRIRTQVDAYWHQMYPMTPFYMRQKSFSPFGESLFETTERIQAAINDLFNHYVDNWNLSVDGMIMYEDGSLASDFIVQPGGELAYSSEPPKQFKFPEPNPQQLTAVMSMVEQAVEAATVPQYLSGVPDSNLDKTAGTASGIKSITEAATEKIGFMRDNFKQSMKTVGYQWMWNARQYKTDVEELRTTSQGKTTPDFVAPSDFQYDFTMTIDDDSMIPVSKEAQRTQFLEYTQQLMGLQKVSMEQAAMTKHPEDIIRLNIPSLIDELSMKFSVKDYSKLIIPQEEGEPEVPEVNPLQPVIDSMSYKDLPQDVQAQVEQAAGLQPSMTHGPISQSIASAVGGVQAPGQPPMQEPAPAVQ